MSKMKKLLAMFVAMIMVFAMGMTTFAADETTNAKVVVNTGEAVNPVVKYLQIVIPDPTSEDGYKVAPAYAQAFTDAGFTVADLIEIAKGETPVNNYAKTGKLNTNEDLATVLQAIATSAGAGMQTATNNEFTATSCGLYLITAQADNYQYSPMAVYVPFNSTETINVTAKGSDIFIKKEIAAGGESVAAGDVVSYTVTSEYPYYGSQYEDVTYTITDTLSKATFNQDSLEVKLNGEDFSADNYDIEYNADNNEFVITFVYDNAYAGGTVTITYDATVGDVTSGDGLKNTVNQKSKPYDNGTLIETEHIVISNPVKLVFAKVDGEDISKKLDGAKFSLYKKGENGAADVLIREDVEGNANGEFTFDGLDAQVDSYYVVETTAPNGYKLNETHYPLTRDPSQDTTTTTTEKVGNVTITTTTYVFANDFHVNAESEGVDTIPNTKLSALPSTGGIGTTIFTIGGCAIMIVAAALYFSSRKKTQK